MSQVSHGHTLQHATTPVPTRDKTSIRHTKRSHFFLHSVGTSFISSLQQATAAVVKIY